MTKLTAATTVAATDLARLLDAATCDALETMCFFCVMGPLESIPQERERISAKLTFQGDAKGVFCSTLEAQSAWAITAGFLGEEIGDISLPQVESVVCEIANMICGSALSNYKKDGHFELSSPEIAGEEDSRPGQAIRRVFELEEGSISVALEFYS